MFKTSVSSSEKYSPSVMLCNISSLKQKYPFLNFSSIGKTVEGREINMIILGSGYKKTLFVGAHHGREYISSAYLMREIEFLSYLYLNNIIYQGFDMISFLNKHSLYFIPMLNPDGVNISVNGKKAAQYEKRIENMRLVFPKYESWKANANGVDLNRNYPALWKEKHSNVLSPASEGFKGFSPASEPEVRALMRLCRMEDFSASATFHAKGEEIYWADQNTADVIPGAKNLALKLSNLCGYKVMPVSKDPAKYAAGFENWFRMEFHKKSFLFELAPYKDGYMPYNMKHFETDVWEKTKLLVPFFAKYA